MSTYLEVYETQWGRRMRTITQLMSTQLHKIGGRLFTSIPALGYVAPVTSPDISNPIVEPVVEAQTTLLDVDQPTSVAEEHRPNEHAN